MASKYEYKMTEKAESDLDEIVSYIKVSLANITAASNFINKFLETIEETIEYPECGPIVVNEFLQIENVRRRLVGSYIMYYLLSHEEKTIYILRIVYGKRNIDEIIKDLGV